MPTRVPSNARLVESLSAKDPDTGAGVTIRRYEADLARVVPTQWLQLTETNAQHWTTASRVYEYTGHRVPQAAREYASAAQAIEDGPLTVVTRFPFRFASAGAR